MNPILELLVGRKQIAKRYEQCFTAVRRQYDVTQLEVDILAYLKNNPACDTASDIVNYRMISKANVSQAVDLLLQKGLLQRREDEADRRRIHLLLRPEAEPLVAEILTAQQHFGQHLLAGISPEELALCHSIHRRIMENAKGSWE